MQHSRTKRKMSIYWKNLRDFWKQYQKNKGALAGLIILVVTVSIAVLASQISPHDPFEMRMKEKLAPPSLGSPMGTDEYGRDILSRIIWGARVSVLIGLGSSAISFLIGVPLGAIAGFLGGKVDEVIMRIVEVFMMLPTFFLILIIASIFGSSVLNVLGLIAITGWPSTARLVRAEFLTLKERDFVEAARATGASGRRIIFGETLPNAIFPAIVDTSLKSAGAIMMEASLSFLGLGDPNQVSWGWMLNSAMQYLRQGWWISFFPGVAIVVIVIAFNLVGDGLNDAMNPYIRER